jgi:predicted nucleotide-binding protein
MCLTLWRGAGFRATEGRPGRTAVEEIESCPAAAFAVVLLTGGDRGGLRDTPYDEHEPRSQQIVVFELGYLVGKLGRARVCLLHRVGVAPPSGLPGLLSLPLDQRGAWRIELGQDLQAAGLPIDPTRLLRA